MSKVKELSEEKRVCHIEEMKEHLLRLVKDPACFYLDDSLSPEMQEKILEQILSLEGCEERPMFEYLENPLKSSLKLRRLGILSLFSGESISRRIRIETM